MKKLLMLLVVLSAVAFAKVKPEEFTLTANVTAVKSHDETTGYHTQTPANCQNPKTAFNKSYCAAAGSNSYAYNQTTYVMVTEIQDRVYELAGPRLELGTYQAKRYPNGFDFLFTDKKGKPKSVWFKIVGERMKETK